MEAPRGNTPGFEEASFGDYQQVVDGLAKKGGKFRRNVKKDYNDDYEDDFHDLSDNDPSNGRKK